MLQAHSKHHVASYFNFAGHEGAGGIQGAFCDGYPVFITDGEGDIGLLDPARDKLANPIGDFESPYTSFIASNITQVGFVDAGCRSRIEYTGRLCEYLGNGHFELLRQLIHEKPLLALM